MHALEPTPVGEKRPVRQEPKQQRSIRTRVQILEAAAVVFARSGFADVTLLDIAEQAGVTKGAVYFHYANKEAIAIAVSEEYFARLGALSAGVRRLKAPPLQATVKLLNRVAVALRDDTLFQAAVRLHLDRHQITSGLPTRPFVDFITHCQDLLAEAKEVGQLPEDADPEKLARVLVAAFFGAQHISWALNDRVDIIDRVQETIDAILPRHWYESADNT
ncbi:ScbR family autoregulator-binding transcription factor [Streptomyces sp. V4I2]|uniref:ScbR family autoregulator-binding transcription factor n=1 Tax=Streptomyces sp. V4I2 TaxID=3042280 RepID=UPI0027810620|nr:ScbR family autoregulator-binding transcription factor [Streptomyces sp. V4I2]MDQ1047458.1 AcrR family transcriptional regulator [Streptomyces sp. V4I2]